MEVRRWTKTFALGGRTTEKRNATDGGKGEEGTEEKKIEVEVKWRKTLEKAVKNLVAGIQGLNQDDEGPPSNSFLISSVFD